MRPGLRNAIVRSRLVCVWLLLWPGAGWSAALDQLDAFLKDVRTARADFEQTVTSGPNRRPQLASGSMALERPGKFRWAYQKPYYQLIVADGEKLWIYDRDLNQVTVRRLGQAIGSSPAALLAGRGALGENFELREAGAAEGLEWIEAVPRKPDSGFELVRLGFRGGAPEAMELRDTLGNVTALRFIRFERNPKLEPGQFAFVPPAGADVVGE
jgi:outer membrane lipoprotein carrier protein